MAIALAKSSLWVKNQNSKKDVKIHFTNYLECFCAKKSLEKTLTIREMRPCWKSGVSVGRWSWVVVRGSWVPSRGSWVPSRGSWVPSRASWVPSRGSWVPSRGSWVPSRGSWVVGYWLEGICISAKTVFRDPFHFKTSSFKSTTTNNTRFLSVNSRETYSFLHTIDQTRGFV